jgi:ribosome biogenesis GTPase
MDSEQNLENGFEDILELSRRCKFSDCTHTNETDCAVKKAISDGILPEEKFNNYFRDKNEAEYVSKQENKTKAIDYMKQLKLFKR